MVNNSIVCAGIDIGKRKLDVAVCGAKASLQVDNTSAGHEKLVRWLQRHKVERVGVEATGGYEQGVVQALRRESIPVVVFQPIQVRAYARFRLKLAKNDKIDANLIAACVASVDNVRAPPDPRFEAFAAAQTLIDQLTRRYRALQDQAARPPATSSAAPSGKARSPAARHSCAAYSKRYAPTCGCMPI